MRLVVPWATARAAGSPGCVLRVRARVEVGAALLGQAFCVLRYAVTTEAGSLPRSLTVNPFWRAQERTSALLGASTERRAVFCVGRAAAVLVEGTTGWAFFAADGALFTVFLLPAGLFALFLPGLVEVFVADLVASCSSGATTSVTPYSAPRTRIASSRASLESSWSFKTITFRHVRGTAAGPTQVGNAKQGTDDAQNSALSSGIRRNPTRASGRRIRALAVDCTTP